MKKYNIYELRWKAFITTVALVSSVSLVYAAGSDGYQDVTFMYIWDYPGTADDLPGVQLEYNHVMDAFYNDGGWYRNPYTNTEVYYDQFVIRGDDSDVMLYAGHGNYHLLTTDGNVIIYNNAKTSTWEVDSENIKNDNPWTEDVEFIILNSCETLRDSTWWDNAKSWGIRALLGWKESVSDQTAYNTMKSWTTYALGQDQPAIQAWQWAANDNGVGSKAQLYYNSTYYDKNIYQIRW